MESYNISTFAMEDSLRWPEIDHLQSACLGIILLDIETISPVEEDLFTPREAARAMRMGPARRRGFTAARVALKRLTRQLHLVEENRPDRAIETLAPDDVTPWLDGSGIYCSASHRASLVAAVAHQHTIGIDLEKVSEQTIRVRHLFMSAGEKALVSLSGLGPERATTRAWTVKEAAAKALGLPLFQSFQEVEIVRVGEADGMMRYQGKTYPVRHAEANGYVITLITCDDL